MTHACDHFHPVYEMSPLQIAQRINRDQVLPQKRAHHQWNAVVQTNGKEIRAQDQSTVLVWRMRQINSASQVNILIDVNVVDTRNPWKVVLAHRSAPIQASAV
jgi:predicted O-linked N-acetylglucosamine transferase (SPINDLY family)